MDYFLNCSSFVGENWIDFESEIANVIKALDAVINALKNDKPIKDINTEKRGKFTDILSVTRNTLKTTMLPTEYKDVSELVELGDLLNTELEKLIRALEIYIADFVVKVSISKRNEDIEKLNPDRIISFNYSNTYKRIYGKNRKIEYNYIHGKADKDKNVRTSNLVLGINEYLDDDRKDKDVEFLTFKKFYQRIYKSTDNSYLDWADEIKNRYEEYQRKIRAASAEKVEPFNNTVLSNLPFQKSVYTDLSTIEYPQYNLYIFGHSLDVTDKDILRLFILNDNVQTKIFYYREDEDDKKELGKIIKNLTKVIGPDELIRRTGGPHKTIEFIPQTISRRNDV